MTYDMITPLYKRLPEGWEDFFELPDVRTILEHIQRKLNERDENIVPNPKDVFNAFRYCDYNTTKVVIWGQDPYYSTWVRNGKRVPTAVGLSFSTAPDNPKISPSLANIFAEINRSYACLDESAKSKMAHPTFTIPTHGDLRGWAYQGVLLLNKALTTIEGEAEAHMGSFNPWEGFIVEVLKFLKKKNPIHVLWGRKAAAIRDLGVLPSNAPILEASHPSPLSATKTDNPFMGCDHFVKINICLRKRQRDGEGYGEIDWQV
jgi:uracil-DNA glycosylase